MADRSYLYLMQARSFLTLTYYVLEYPTCQQQCLPNIIVPLPAAYSALLSQA